MLSPSSMNEFYLAVLPALVSEGLDLTSSEEAFGKAVGDFRAKFTAAVEARFAQVMAPEIIIEIPPHPEKLLNRDLEALVRSAGGYLSSSPTKAELLSHLGRIRRSQERLPSWVPRVDSEGNPIPRAETLPAESERTPDRQLTVRSVPELGEITVLLPEAGDDRLELPLTPGGLGEWESVVFTALGIAGSTPDETITIDAAANEVLVPEDIRWWPLDSSTTASAADDPGVASELLATSDTLGGLTVVDSTPAAYNAVVDALIGAGDWRYGPRWLLESSLPDDGTPVRTVARAAIAGWADEHRSGVIVYVHGGTSHASDGVVGCPHPLHSYLLVLTRGGDGTDAAQTVSRIPLSCPGEFWCHRGGCTVLDELEIFALLNQIVAGAAAAEADSAAGNHDSDGSSSYHELYGDGVGPSWAETPLDEAMAALTRAEWFELARSEWEGGLEEGLLRRGPHCLSVRYDPVTRQIEFADGKEELASTLQLLTEDGLITSVEDEVSVDFTADTAERWNGDLLSAADDLLRGRIENLSHRSLPMQVTVLGLHPHADGVLRGPEASALVSRQLRQSAAAAGLISNFDQDAR